MDYDPKSSDYLVDYDLFDETEEVIKSKTIEFFSNDFFLSR